MLYKLATGSIDFDIEIDIDIDIDIDKVRSSLRGYKHHFNVNNRKICRFHRILR
jgi:hypothetical protein